MLGFLKNASIGKKLALINGFSLIILCIVGVAGYRGVSVLHKHQDDIANQLYAVRNMTLIDKMHDALRAVAFRAVLAAEQNNEIDKRKSLEELQDFSKKIKVYFDNLDKLPLHKETRDAIAKTRPLVDDYIVASGAIVNLALNGRIKEASSKLPEFQRTFEKLEQELDNLGRLIEEDAKSSLKSGDQAATLSEQISMILIVTALILGVLLSLFRSRLITASLRQVLNSIAASSTEIAASVNETTTTMDELGASSQQSAEQAEASAAGAHQALALSEDGTRAVRQTLDGMSTLKEKVEAIAEQILRLSEQTSQIGGISDIVGNLANQTNMLALNAAVEAARAGEHGKGFGVVAGEIRKLADQSKKSAQKINDLVKDIQAAINTTVMVTDEGTKNVDAGMKLAQGTAEAFIGVADSINNVFLNSQQISLNAKQQAIAIHQVVEAMNAINLGAKESTSGVTQVRVSTQQLNEAAHKLKALV